MITNIKFSKKFVASLIIIGQDGNCQYSMYEPVTIPTSIGATVVNQ